MKDAKKDEIMQKLYTLLEEYEWGEGAKSIRVSVTIETEKEKEIYEASERK